jgi:hypothetical protein
LDQEGDNQNAGGCGKVAHRDGQVAGLLLLDAQTFVEPGEPSTYPIATGGTRSPES